MPVASHTSAGLETAAKSVTQQDLQLVLGLRPSRAGFTFEGRVGFSMKRRPNGGKPHPNSVDKTGMVFGRLTVLERIMPAINHCYNWKCKCQCGQTVIISSRKLSKNGGTESCGCLLKDIMHQRQTHGDSTSKEYKIWNQMKMRCENESDPAFQNYGGGGIRVCERWRNSYEAFLKDMGRCPDGLSIDRKDNNGNYEPSNCRWVTKKQQNRNRRDNCIFTVRGITGCMSELSERFGIANRTAWYRIRKAGWDIETAFVTPVK